LNIDGRTNDLDQDVSTESLKGEDCPCPRTYIETFTDLWRHLCSAKTLLVNKWSYRRRDDDNDISSL